MTAPAGAWRFDAEARAEPSQKIEAQLRDKAHKATVKGAKILLAQGLTCPMNAVPKVTVLSVRRNRFLAMVQLRVTALGAVLLLPLVRCSSTICAVGGDYQ